MDKVTISVRDYQSQRVLANHGFKNVLMTGCPAWYNIEKIGYDFVQPEALNKIIYTPPQNELFSNQSIQVLNYLVGRFSSSEITVAFHRGIDEIDRYTSNSEANNNHKLAAAAQKLGLNIIDLSYGSDKFSLYDDCDLHIGYRVHAHIYFLANRLPSIIINEDGRGISASEALKTPGINAFRKSKYFFEILRFKKNSLISRVYSKFSQKPNNQIVKELEILIENMIETNYEAFIESSRTIDEKYIVMKDFINLILNHEEYT
jgi:polysaccharide pyruvyl transferase WcaK-like protein